MTDTLRIGGASGCWGETPLATGQLLAVPGLDVLAYDHLAEITGSIGVRKPIRTASPIPAIPTANSTTGGAA